MGLKLTDEPIDKFESCVGEPLLAFLEWPPNSRQRCFSYPQYLINENNLHPLTYEAFPNDGCLPMLVRGISADEMMDDLGNIVIMSVNTIPRENDNFISGTENSRYNSLYDPTYRGPTPAIEFEALRRHRLSSQLMQVVEVYEDTIDFIHLQAVTLHVYEGQSLPQTKFILVALNENEKRKLYGPFEYVVGEGDEIHLKASSHYGFYIAGLFETSLDFTLTLMNSDVEVAACFVDAEEFSEKFKGIAHRFDWIPDEYLLDVVGRIARTSRNLDLTKKKIQTFKRELEEYHDLSDQIEITPERRTRMAELVSNYENWQELSEEAKRAKIMNADMAQLAEFVLNDENFRDFYNKVIDHEGLKEQVEQRKAEFHLEEKKVQQQIQELQDQVKAYQNNAEKKKQELLADIKAEVNEKEKERSLVEAETKRLQGEVGALEQKKRELDEDIVLVQRQIRTTVEQMSNDVTVSTKILENEMIKQIVKSISGNSLEEETLEAADTFEVKVRADENALNEKQLIGYLHKALQAAGRDLEYNQVINLLICLQQGYITTFAGLPGTGKTSLAGLLAGVLGLRNTQVNRYCEISVEKGWTSYKDLIGYYNPFTHNLERAVAFDAFERLSHEQAGGSANEAEGSTVPFVFLLDEANLSSLEHYWSPFLRACDSFGAGSFSIPLGGAYSFEVPELVRFIATVNFDHTIEELSPRFLDRSWVITLDPDNEIIDEADLTEVPDYSQVLPFSYEKLQEVFGAHAGDRMGNDARNKLKEVLDVCAAYRFPVSPRSQKMMKDYIATAERLMNTSSVQATYAPVDFAVAQKVLPQLAGTEERILELLQKLDAINGLPETKKRIQRMLEVGSEHGYYQYFG